VRRAVVGERLDRGLPGLECQGELVPPELQGAEPDQHQDVVGREVAGVRQGGLGRGVERGVGGLADPLEEGQAEVPLGAGVVGIRLDPLGQPVDERLGGRLRGGRCRCAG
jgi:hypothetical protein